MNAAQSLQVPGYQVMQFLGSGARSTIWQVRDRDTEEVYVLKRVVKRQPSDARFMEQAHNEFEVGSRLDHPIIRRVYKMQRVKRWLALREIHLIMEYCEGKTLQEDPPQDVGEVVRVFNVVAAALAHMNSRGFVHADMKPNNIVVASDGTVKIIDLGQSCRIGTSKARIQGTPDFIAPEQVRRQPLDGRTDVFNFGASLYWTLTGRPIPTVIPKEGQSSIRLLSDFVPTSPEQMNPQVPPALSKLVAECIELRPAQRPRSMHEVGSRLSLIARSLATAASGGEPTQDAKG